MRALGLQLPVSITTLVCYYLFGLPLAIYLGFNKGLALYGFWLGFTLAVTILDLLVIVLVMRADWDRKEEQAEEEDSEWSLQSALKKVSSKGGFAAAASPL